MTNQELMNILQYPGSQKCMIWSEEENDWKTHSITMRPKLDKLLCHYKETGVYSYAKLGQNYSLVSCYI